MLRVATRNLYLGKGATTGRRSTHRVPADHEASEPEVALLIAPGGDLWQGQVPAFPGVVQQGHDDDHVCAGLVGVRDAAGDLSCRNGLGERRLRMS